jgi:hypothetical protein
MTFAVKNPLQNDGGFARVLTKGQWKAIRQLVKDETGAILHWYVESWDGMKRYCRTDVMSFILSE